MPSCSHSRRRAANFSRQGNSTASFSNTMQQHRSLRFESLEERRLLAVYTVSNLNDAGAGSLRQAMLDANATTGIADEIVFQAGLTGTINIASQLPTIIDDLTITGPGAELLTIDAGDGTDNTFGTGDGYRIFKTDLDLGASQSPNWEISGLRLTGGDTDATGGAVFLLGAGTIVIADCTISGNSSGNGGGGISVWSGHLLVTNCNIIGNSADDWGGGISSNFSSVTTLSDSIVSGNSSRIGGGVHNFARMTIIDSRIAGNFGDFGGGIENSETMTIASSTISGNSASDTGGGILTSISGTLDVISSTISGNSANDRGGGIYSVLTDLTIANSSISGNSGTNIGGGIYIESGSVDLTNTIVANSTSGGDIYLDPEGTLTGSHNLIEDGSHLSSFTNSISGDPMLGPLADNGGLTQTHALQAGSPALNMGDPSTGEAWDQRGNPFLRNDGNGVDIGAFELQTFSPTSLIVTTTEDEFGSSNDALSLREAISAANAVVGPDTITFAPSLAGKTITLAGTQMEITDELTIDANALAKPVTVDAHQRSRIFDITATTGNFTFRGLNLTGGRTTGSGEHGGAINSESAGLLTIEESTLSNNQVLGDSANGGSAFTAGFLALTRSTISGSSAANLGGGAVGIAGAIVDESTISENQSGDFGGGIVSGANITVSNSTINGNIAGGDGGGVWALNGNADILNSTVSGNEAIDDGGGIFASSSTLHNSTVTENNATGNDAQGGGIVSYFPVTIGNSIVAGNTAVLSNPDLRFVNPVTQTIEYSLIGDSSGTALSPTLPSVPDTNGNLIGSGGTPIDPFLGPLIYNGGPTHTHALRPGGPAIDAGDPTILPNPAEGDQRGLPFLRNYNGRVDMGAYEWQPLLADADNDGVVTGSDFLSLQRTPTTSIARWEAEYGVRAPTPVTTLQSLLSTYDTEPLSSEPFAAEDTTGTLEAARAWSASPDIYEEENDMEVREVLFAEWSVDEVNSDGFPQLTEAAVNQQASHSTDKPGEAESEPTWLSDKLLEDVFR